MHRILRTVIYEYASLMHAVVHICKMQSYGSAHMEAQCSNYTSSNPSSTHVNNSIHGEHSGSASHCSLSAADLTPSQGSWSVWYRHQDKSCREDWCEDDIALSQGKLQFSPAVVICALPAGNLAGTAHLLTPPLFRVRSKVQVKTVLEMTFILDSDIEQLSPASGS